MASVQRNCSNMVKLLEHYSLRCEEPTYPDQGAKMISLMWNNKATHRKNGAVY